MSKKTNNNMTLRQRMRFDAEAKLDSIIDSVNDATAKVLLEAGTEIHWWDVLHLAGSKKSKSLRANLVTKLANEAEKELEKLYNNQQSLKLEKKDAA